MARQENSLEIKNTSSRVTLHCTIASLRYLFVNSKTLPFIAALVVAYTYVESAVLSSFMDYITYSMEVKENQRVAAIVSNLLDGLSSLSFVIVSVISEAYTGCFTMIIFCTAASIQGLMLLWASATPSPSTSHFVYGAIFFLALGNSGQYLLENFFQYQLNEKIEAIKKDRKLEHGSTLNKKKQDLLDTVLTKSWLYGPFIVGYAVTVYIAFTIAYDTYTRSFRFAALFMGGSYMLFIFSSAWNSPEKLPVESNLRKIYRICKAAFGKRRAKYPTSTDCYYWKGDEQKHFYKHGEGQRLSPRVPWLFRWLDKAAIVKSDEESRDSEVSLETQERKGQLCTVKEVKEVKSLVLMMYLIFSFFAYSLLLATGNTFFVSQASNMTTDITTDGNDISILFIIKDVASVMSQFMCSLILYAFRNLRKHRVIKFKCKRKAGTIIRIGFGMVCAVICSLIAWQVEVRRLKVNNGKYHHPAGGNSTVNLVPQFSFLGMTEGLVEDGFTSLFYGHVAKPMWSFQDEFSKLVIGSGKLLLIPFVLIFSSWFKETVNTSHLDRFYLMLGILNAAFLLVFAYYSFRYAYKVECPEDEEADSEEDESGGEISAIEELIVDNADFISESNNDRKQLGDQVGSDERRHV